MKYFDQITNGEDFDEVFKRIETLEEMRIFIHEYKQWLPLHQHSTIQSSQAISDERIIERTIYYFLGWNRIGKAAMNNIHLIRSWSQAVQEVLHEGLVPVIPQAISVDEHRLLEIITGETS